MNEALNKVDDYARSVLRELLDQCTPAQQDLFRRLYISMPETMPPDKLRWAIIQCENTVKLNELKADKEKREHGS